MIKMEIGRRRRRLMQSCRNKGKETKALNIPVDAVLLGPRCRFLDGVCEDVEVIGGVAL